MSKKTEAAKLLGSLGGKQRAENLTAEELSEIGKLAVTARNSRLTPERRRQIAKKAAKVRWGETKK